MKLKILIVVLALGFLTACGASAPLEEGETASVAPGELAAVELRDGKAVGVDTDGNVVDASLKELLGILSDRVLFDYDRYNLRSQDFRTLVDIYAALMKQNDKINIVIEGHADERGTREYNLALGERRANTIYERMIAGGVAARRLEKLSYGKERPVAKGSDEESWAQNRRGMILVFNF